MIPKVSIIVPVYDVERYLHKCINSLINQTLEEIEIILVNDGSKDNSGYICDGYSKKDSRIKVIHKENGGLSDARNAGINVASGEYITFVDSDDWFEPNMLDSYYISAITYDVDVVIQGFTIDYEKEKYSVKNVSDIYCAYKGKQEVGNGILLLEYKGLLNSACNKLYKNKIIKDNGLKFELDGVPAEDLLFNCDYFSYINSMYISNESSYHYIKRENETLTAKYIPNYHMKIISYYKAREKLYEKLCLNTSEATTKLNESLIFYTLTALTNIYRKNALLNFTEKSKIIKYLISEKQIFSAIGKNRADNLYIKIMKACFKTKSSCVTNVTFTILFFFRYRLTFIYNKVRMRILYG